jgi:hypothetical protein
MAMTYEDLDIKTVWAESPAEIDKLCNEFKKNHVVRFTQANQVWCGDEGLAFVNTMFYVPEKSSAVKPMGIPTNAPPGGVTIDPSLFVKKSEAIVENLRPAVPAKKAVPESEAEWTNCTVCNSRFKFTHFRMCPQKHGIEGVPDDKKLKYREIWG